MNVSLNVNSLQIILFGLILWSFLDATGPKDYKELSGKLDWIFVSNFKKCDDYSIDYKKIYFFY